MHGALLHACVRVTGDLHRRGLYFAQGVSNKSSKCQTCNQSLADCTGHFGAIPTSARSCLPLLLTSPAMLAVLTSRVLRRCTKLDMYEQGSSHAALFAAMPGSARYQHHIHLQVQYGFDAC